MSSRLSFGQGLYMQKRSASSGSWMFRCERGGKSHLHRNAAGVLRNVQPWWRERFEGAAP